MGRTAIRIQKDEVGFRAGLDCLTLFSKLLIRCAVDRQAERKSVRLRDSGRDTCSPFNSGDDQRATSSLLTDDEAFLSKITKISEKQWENFKDKLRLLSIAEKR